MSADSAKVVHVGNLRHFRRAAERTGMSAALIARESMDVTLTKGDRLRRYWIRPGKHHEEWYCQVWFSADLQHRGDIVVGLVPMQRVKAQYEREIGELERDGWM